jgi:hypothetical protein
MRKKMYGIVAPIKAAPSFHALKVFGGDLTIEEFRSFGTRDACVPKQIEEVSEKNTVIKHTPTFSQTNKLFQISDSSGTNEPLRLKRPKPLKRDENNLEKTLGITRKKVPTTNGGKP